jgi:hypothetical protein
LTAEILPSFQVEEVFTEQNELLVLSLGFASPEDAFDVIHIVCGRERSGRQPAPVEDLLYIERTDQDRACDGRDVLCLVAHDDRIELGLTQAGARLLGLAESTAFLFDRQPALFAAATEILAAMVRAGQDQISVAS